MRGTARVGLRPHPFLSTVKYLPEVCFWPLNSPKKGKTFVYKRFANPGQKRESLLL